MKFFIMVQSLSLCLIGYEWCAGRFKKFLKMIFGWPRLVLEVMFGSRYTLLTRVAGFLIATTVAGYYGDTTGLPLLPFLATLGTFRSTLNGGLGWCGSATAGGHFCVA
jgi:hypothetical protein